MLGTILKKTVSRSDSDVSDSNANLQSSDNTKKISNEAGMTSTKLSFLNDLLPSSEFGDAKPIAPASSSHAVNRAPAPPLIPSHIAQLSEQSSLLEIRKVCVISLRNNSEISF